MSGFVKALFNREQRSATVNLAKCCHGE